MEDGFKGVSGGEPGVEVCNRPLSFFFFQRSPLIGPLSFFLFQRSLLNRPLISCFLKGRRFYVVEDEILSEFFVC